MLGSFLKWILSLFLGSTEPEVQEEPDVQEETEEKPDLSLEQDTEFKQDEPIHDNELELEVEKKIFTKSSKKKGLLVGINYNNDKQVLLEELMSLHNGFLSKQPSFKTDNGLSIGDITVSIN